MNFFIHYLSGYVIQRDYIEVPYRANVLEAWASKISFDQFSDLKKKMIIELGQEIGQKELDRKLTSK